MPNELEILLNEYSASLNGAAAAEADKQLNNRTAREKMETIRRAIMDGQTTRDTLRDYSIVAGAKFEILSELQTQLLGHVGELALIIERGFERLRYGADLRPGDYVEVLNPFLLVVDQPGILIPDYRAAGWVFRNGFSIATRGFIVIKGEEAHTGLVGFPHVRLDPHRFEMVNRSTFGSLYDGGEDNKELEIIIGDAEVRHRLATDRDRFLWGMHRYLDKYLERLSKVTSTSS